MEKQNSLVYGLGGVIIGGLLVWFLMISAINTNQTGMMRMMGVRSNERTTSTISDDTDESKTTNFMSKTGMHMSMDDMMHGLSGKTGDAFDKEFLVEMIDHHQGAIDMAKEAQKNAKHDELKSMADDIISAQTKEIEQMKSWQTEWGY